MASSYVRQAFRKYLECGIFAHGFARAWCDDCGHDYFVAYSCKGRGVCPSRNTRRMVEMAAHLCDHVFPRLPVRQWVLSVPKRLRYYMQCDGAVLNMVLRVFLRVIAQSLQSNSPGAAQAHDRALERLLRYCARPLFAMDRLRKEGTSLVYCCAEQHSEPSSDKRGAKADELHLTPLAFIAAGTQIRKILDHIGVDSQPPHISPARGPPLWDDCDAHVGDGVAAEPDWAADWDGAAQPASDHEIGQCINW